MGGKRFPLRADVKRDSGILYHFVGPEKIWPRSAECQIQETDTADFWLVDDTESTGVVSEKFVYKKASRQDAKVQRPYRVLTDRSQRGDKTSGTRHEYDCVNLRIPPSKALTSGVGQFTWVFSQSAF